MRKLALVLCFMLSSMIVLGQIKFEKGYLIGQDGIKTECLIKNTDWAYNPAKIKYQLPGNQEIKEGDPLQIKEFGIETELGWVQYVGATVQVDVLRDVDGSAEPRWSTRTLFLKTIRDGKASLYSYEEGGLPVYFYAVDSVTPKQLFYKEFRSRGENRLMHNNTFRGQLWADVKCKSTNFDGLQKLRYTRGDLEKYIDAYNECEGITKAGLVKKDKREILHVYIQGGMSYGNLSSTMVYQPYDHTIKGVSGYKFGVAAELVLPFNKGKWGILVEPSYDHIAGSAANDKPGGFIYYDQVKMFRDVIEIPLGVRYYFSKSKMFNYYLSAYYALALNIKDSRVDYYRFNYITIRSWLNYFHGVAIGPGMNFGRFGADLRYTLSAAGGVKFSGLALTAKVRIF